MSSFQILKLEYSACVEALTDALRTEDETAFFAAVDHIVHMREPGMFKELRQLTGDLQKALERFSIESRLQDIAENEIPDARARLTHVINMTDEAAHRTLDLVEQSGPLAERTAQEAAALIESFEQLKNRAASGPGYDSVLQSVEGLVPLVQVGGALPAGRPLQLRADPPQPGRCADGAGLPGSDRPDHPQRHEAGRGAGNSPVEPREPVGRCRGACHDGRERKQGTGTRRAWRDQGRTSLRARQTWMRCCRVSECKVTCWTY